ncbi:transglycosylase TgdA [Streptomyces albiaxialis]|uniref:Transglycosylase TgdA n=1 Tax=Streptomyces albiaxialis TaxID=329523 RepID=A0ABN2X6G3_9ACTN
MSKGLMLGAAAAVLAIPVLAVGGAVIALADEEEEQDAGIVAGGLGLNTALLPDRALKYVPWVKKSATQCEGLSPGILAAQIQQESQWRTNVTSGAGAQGIAQFIPSTFAAYGEDSDGDGHTGTDDPEDSIMAQGKYMCSLLARAKKSQYGGNPMKLALAGYNAGWGAVQKYRGIPPYKETSHYVTVITKNAAKLNTAVTISGSGDGAKATRRAATQLGIPYSWGGGKPNGPSKGFCDGTNGYIAGKCSAAVTSGFDCSSLVQYAYWPTTQLPRTAADQYGATSNRTVSRSELEVGDLLFWSHGRAGGIYHVAIYKGNGQIIQAPRTTRDGKTVAKIEVKSVAQAMPAGDYYGATRPN